MRIRERFSDNYLRADDLTDPIVLTIDGIDEVSIGDDERIVLEFRDFDKCLPLNKTNALALADMFGDETDEWLGKTIELYKDRVMFQGRRTPAVRVRLPREQRPQKPQPRPQQKQTV